MFGNLVIGHGSLSGYSQQLVSHQWVGKVAFFEQMKQLRKPYQNF
jgi:hypothetical protein